MRLKQEGLTNHPEATFRTQAFPCQDGIADSVSEQILVCRRLKLELMWHQTRVMNYDLKQKLETTS